MEKTSLNNEEMEMVIQTLGHVSKHLPTEQAEFKSQLIDILISLRQGTMRSEKNAINVDRFSDRSVHTFKKHFERFIESYKKDTGIELLLDGALSYSDNVSEFKLKAVIVEDEHNPDSALQVMFKTDLPRYAHLGLKEEHFKMIIANTYELIGFDNSARKYKYITRNITDNSRHSFPEHRVIDALNRLPAQTPDPLAV